MATAGITGGAELRYVAGRLRKAAARDLSRELRAGQRKAVRPLQPAVKASATTMLPKRGGYNITMARAVKVSTRIGVRAGTVSVRVYATGKGELRDVVAVNNGILRHPVFGVWRKAHKGPRLNAPTRVPRGFVDKPFDALQERIVAESNDAIGRVLESIARS